MNIGNSKGKFKMTIMIAAELRDEATAQLRMLLDRMSNRQGFFKAVGDQLVGSTGENFRGEHDPSGAPWVPLAPATIRARQRRGKSQIRILSETGVLSGSVHAEATNNDVRIGSAVPYAAIHQLGGTVQKQAGSRWMAGRRFARRDKHPEGRDVGIRAHAITIPARPYLGVSADDEVSIMEMAEAWLAGNL